MDGFGCASTKNEGDHVFLDELTPNNGAISDSRWVEAFYSPNEFKEIGIGQETIEVICAEIESQFNHLDVSQKYIAITALINRLIPESGY